MTRSQIWFQNFSNFWVSVTGLALVYFNYFWKNPDPFSNLGSPWALIWHNSHILVAPLLVFAVGLIWRNHIWPKFVHLSLPRMGILKGLSGLMLLATLIPMVLSGALIQVTADETFRKIWINTHVFTSLIWVVFSVLHVVKKKLR
jgi:hypothetical protein